jgi:hypothetical protein
MIRSHRVRLVAHALGAAALATAVLSGCGLAGMAAEEAAGAASCGALGVAKKGLDHTGNLSADSIANIAGAARVVTSFAKELPLDAIPDDAAARLEDAANQLDLASKAYDSNPQGATEVVDRAVGQINGVVADVEDRLDC